MTAAPSILKSCKLYLGGYDLSGLSNSLSLSQEFDEVDCTAFGDTCRHGMPGLAKISFEHQGYFATDGTNLNGSDEASSAAVGVTGVPMMVCPTTGAVASIAHFFPAVTYKYAWGGSLGDMTAFAITGNGSSGYSLIRGQIMGTGAKTSTANGTAYQLGAVTSTQKLYAQLHVLAVSGTDPTLDVIVESDDAEGFTSGATRIAFTQKTAIGAQWATPVAGAITDDWWRIGWTIGGTETPSFTIAVAVGIL